MTSPPPLPESKPVISSTILGIVDPKDRDIQQWPCGCRVGERGDDPFADQKPEKQRSINRLVVQQCENHRDLQTAIAMKSGRQLPDPVITNTGSAKDLHKCAYQWRELTSNGVVTRTCGNKAGHISLRIFMLGPARGYHLKCWIPICNDHVGWQNTSPQDVIETSEIHV